MNQFEAKLNHKNFQVILGTSTGWLPFYYMGVRAMIGGMNNWAPEIMTAMTRAALEGNQEQSEKLYVMMMDLSAKRHFIDSTLASLMGLYARGYDAGFPRKPMQLLPFSDPKYREITQWLNNAFAELGIPMETGDAATV